MAGRKGRSGRHPKEVRQRWEFLVEQEKIFERMCKMAAGKITEAEASDEVSAARLTLSYAYGQPTAHTELTGKDGGPIETKQTWVVAGKEISF